MAAASVDSDTAAASSESVENVMAVSANGYGEVADLGVAMSEVGELDGSNTCQDEKLSFKSALELKREKSWAREPS